MKPPYFSLLATMAALAGLMLWMQQHSLPDTHFFIADEYDLNTNDFSPPVFSDCEDEVEVETTDHLITEIDGFAAQSWDDLNEIDKLPFHSFITVSQGEIRLAWIAAQQYPDGGWVACLPAAQKNLTPRLGRNGATGLALLCLLETGYTHQEKTRYRNQIAKGLQFLIDHKDGKNSDSTTEVYSFEDVEGRMVSHAIATLALCEAYSLTKDKALLPHVQGALNYMVHCQRENGGWGVERAAAPDLVTTGWIVMGIERAVLSYLKVEPSAINAAKAFVERSKSSPKNRLRPLELAMWGKVTILFGATRESPGMAECVRELDTLGFSHEDCAYNYLAYSVMRRWSVETQWRWRDARRKLDEEIQKSNETFQETWPPYERAGKHDFWNSRLERTCLMYLAGQLESGSNWRHETLRQRPEPPRDESFPL